MINDKEILDYSAELISYKNEIDTGEATKPDLDDQVRLKFTEDSINRSKFIDSTIVIGAASKEFRNVFGIDAPHYEISENCHLAVDKNGDGEFGSDEYIEIKDDTLHIKDDPYSFMDCQEIINAARFDSTIKTESGKPPVDSQRFFVDSKKDQESSQYHHPVCPPGFDKWAGKYVYDYICKNYDLNEITLYKTLSIPESNTIPYSFTINQIFNGDNPFECNINELGIITKNNFVYTFDNNNDQELQKAYNNGDFRMPKKGCNYKDEFPIKWYEAQISVSSERMGNKYYYRYDYTGSPFQFSSTPLVEFQLIESGNVFNRGYAILCMDPKGQTELPTEGDKYLDGVVTIKYCVHILWKEKENLDAGASQDRNRKFLWWSWTTRSNKNYTVTFNPISSLPDDVKTKIASFIETMEDDCLRYYNLMEIRDINTVIPNATTSIELMKDLRDSAASCASSASSWEGLMDSLFVRTAYDILEEKVDKFSSAASYASGALVYNNTTQQILIPNPDYIEPQPEEGYEVYTRSYPDETIYEYDGSDPGDPQPELFVEVDDNFDETKTYYINSGIDTYEEIDLVFSVDYIYAPIAGTTYYSNSGHVYSIYDVPESSSASSASTPQYISDDVITRDIFKSKTDIAAEEEWDPTKWESLGLFDLVTEPTTNTTLEYAGTTEYITDWKGVAVNRWPKFLWKLLFKQTWEPVYSSFPKIIIKSTSIKKSFNTTYQRTYTLGKDEYLGPPSGDTTKNFSGNHMKTLSYIISDIMSEYDVASLKKKNIINSDGTLIRINNEWVSTSSSQKYEVVYESIIEENPSYDNIKRAQSIDNFLTTNPDLFKVAFNTLGDRIDKRTGTLRKTYSILESANINAQMIEQRKRNIERLSKVLNAYSITGGFGTNEATINLATWEPYTSSYSNLARGSTVYIVGDNTRLSTRNITIAGQTIKISQFSANYVKTTITDIIDLVSDTQYEYTLTEDTEIQPNKTYYVFDDNTGEYRMAKESDFKLVEVQPDIINQIFYEQGNATAGPIFKVMLNYKIPNLFKGNHPRLVKVF